MRSGRLELVLLLALALVHLPSTRAHDGPGCAHASVLERERAAISRSLLMNAAASAKEAARQLPGQVLQQPPPPAVPRIWLDFQLAGFVGNKSLVAQVTSDTMPTAVKVLQKLFKASCSATAQPLERGLGAVLR